jgi:hypothetical protein
MTGIRATRSLLLALAVATGAPAQVSSTNRLDIGQKMKQNAISLTHYTYKRRTEVVLKGQPRGARVDLVRYVDGHKETIPLETPARTEPSRRGRGLRGKLVEKKIEKKKEKMRAEIERLRGVMNGYLSPDSDSMRSILRKAEISKNGSGPDAQIRLTAVGLKQPSDSFTMVWSRATGQPVSIEIRAAAEGKPVQHSVNYSTLPDGTFFPAKTVISSSKKNVLLTITRFDYTGSPQAHRSN